MEQNDIHLGNQNTKSNTTKTIQKISIKIHLKKKEKIEK